jgi:hypothetical protein
VSLPSRPRVAVVTSHPMQYHAPWFRGLAGVFDLQVLYAHRPDAAAQARAGYGVAFDWRREAGSSITGSCRTRWP